MGFLSPKLHNTQYGNGTALVLLPFMEPEGKQTPVYVAFEPAEGVQTSGVDKYHNCVLLTNSA